MEILIPVLIATKKDQHIFGDGYHICSHNRYETVSKNLGIPMPEMRKL